MRRPGLSAILLGAFLVSGCSTTIGDTQRALTAEQVDAIYANAVNQNGWTDVDPPTWAALTSEACETGAWDHDVNAALTQRFLTDLGMVDRPQADQVPGIIWMNLHVACHDLVPSSAFAPPGSLDGSTGVAETTAVTGAFVSPSLERVGDLRPNEWPWFSDRVPVPPDAMAGGSDFVDILDQVQALSDFTILSAGRPAYDGPDLRWRSAVLKVSDDELLEIRTQLSKVEPTTVGYPAPGIRYSRWKPQSAYVNIQIDNRLVIVHSIVTDPFTGEVSLTTNDLFAIAEQIILLYEIQP